MNINEGRPMNNREPAYWTRLAVAVLLAGMNPTVERLPTRHRTCVGHKITATFRASVATTPKWSITHRSTSQLGRPILFKSCARNSSANDMRYHASSETMLTVAIFRARKNANFTATEAERRHHFGAWRTGRVVAWIRADVFTSRQAASAGLIARRDRVKAGDAARSIRRKQFPTCTCLGIGYSAIAGWARS